MFHKPLLVLLATGSTKITYFFLRALKKTKLMYAQNFISTTEYITLTSQQVFISKVTNLFSVK